MPSPYRQRRLGLHDRVDELMGRVVRSGSTIWTAELLEDLPLGKPPVPFKEIEHSFPTLEGVCEWLGDPVVKSNVGRSAFARSAWESFNS